jgi:hypothetical protein
VPWLLASGNSLGGSALIVPVLFNWQVGRRELNWRSSDVNRESVGDWVQFQNTLFRGDLEFAGRDRVDRKLLSPQEYLAFDNSWNMRTFEDPGGMFPFATVPVQIPMQDIYHKIEFESARNELPGR